MHGFEKKPEGTGDYQVPAGGSVRLRYRFLFHHGDPVAADVAGHFSPYAKETHENN
jgi:hypothetical protein